MEPTTTRRRLLSGASVACIAAVTGCIGSGESGTANRETTAATTTERRTTERRTTERRTTGRRTTERRTVSVESLSETVRSYFEARTEDPLDARRYLHPVHPVRSEAVGSETAKRLLSIEGEIVDIALEAQRRDVSVGTVLSAPLFEATDVAHDAVADALEGARTVLVEATLTMADGSRETARLLAVTAEGEWAVLAHGIEPAGESADPFGGRVVTDVTFDTDTDRARVYFDDDLTADRITAKAKQRYSRRSSSTPDVVSYFVVRLDPSGDELIVTATVDGKTFPIHREQYPPGDRLVDDVTFVGDGSGRACRVGFNRGASDGTIVVESTIAGDVARRDAVGAGSQVSVDAAPRGDEVVVKAERNDGTDIVHRERHVF